MAKRVEILLTRHGATPLNAESGSGPDRIRGWDDVALSKQGREEAKKLARRLANSGIEIIVCSDLSRAADTAKDIAEATGAELFKDSDLRPWNLGKFTGQESSVVARKILSYAKNKPDLKVPKDGESFDEFRKRAMGGIVNAINKAKGRKLAIVSHYRVERLLKSWIDAGEEPDGSLNWATFAKHGESTAHAEKMEINVEALAKASTA